MTPESTRLVIDISDPGEKTLEKAEKFARRILEVLPHTPITGLGVNLGFVEDRPPDSMESLFKRGDDKNLAAGGYTVLVTKVERVLNIPRGILNTRLAMDHESGKLSVGLNFHHTGAGPEEIAASLDNRVIWCKDFAIKLLSSTYGLRWEEEK